MSILAKEISIAQLEPAIPGLPGTPPNPAYCASETTTEPQIRRIYIGTPGEIGYGSYDEIDYTPVTKTVCYPATPGTPATPSTPASVFTQFNLGWNSGAQSLGFLLGDGTASFSAGSSNVGAVVGLAGGEVQYLFTTASHAIYFSGGMAAVLESGVIASGAVPYSSSDVFRIERSASTVRYYKGDTLIHVSASPSYGTRHLIAALYSGGDTVIDTSLSETVTAGRGGGGAVLVPVAAFGGIESSSGASSMAPLSASGTGFSQQGGRAVLAPLLSVASQGKYASSTSVMAPIRATGEAGTVPTFALGAALLSPVIAGGHGMTAGNTTGEASASTMSAIISLGADRPYGGGVASIGPISAVGAKLRAVSYAAITSPPIKLRAIGHDSSGENSAQITAPAAALSAFCGASSKIAAPPVGLSASATVVQSCRADLAAPAASVSASATVSATSRCAITAPRVSMVGYAGAVCSITIKGASSVTARATTGSVAKAAISAPRATLELFEATVEGFCNASIIAPAVGMAGSMQAWLISPPVSLSAVGTAVVAASYEAYSINLQHAAGDQAPADEVTRYTNFPFTHVVRFRGSYFGVAGDGLYLLDGTTDDGEPIAYSIKTCASDFKSPELKTVASAYLAGRLEPVAVTLFAGEDGAESYAYATLRGPTAKAHREKFGRGVKNRYFALGLDGEDALELDSIELEINKMSRRI